ncbi:poly(A) polymerase gamma-like [Cydia fagiglandana]|uniref:poly(A) polymerase gamma-like n=1 Tax=Cydia fagiglandana TaxID=1458189 RepID=UPI002FEE05AC
MLREGMAIEVFLSKSIFCLRRLNVDLTYDISTFTKSVHYQAENTNMLREGMAIEVRHVRRKQLHQYLSASLLVKRERTASGTKRKPDAQPVKPAPKKTKRLSESSTDEVSILSYNDDSNSSNVYELNLNSAPAPPAAAAPPAAPAEPAAAAAAAGPSIACT